MTRPESVFSWLQDLLAERFGESLRFLQGDSGFSTLALEGSSRRVRILVDPRFLDVGLPSLPCAVLELPSSFSSLPFRSLHAPGVSPDLASDLSSLIEEGPTGLSLHYDVLGLAYWMLTRCEEVGREDVDEHGRFPARASHASLYGYLDRPLVDDWFLLLGDLLERVWPGFVRRRYEFGVSLSHDVDTPSRYGFVSPPRLIRLMAGDVAKRRSLELAFSKRLRGWLAVHCARRLSREDPCNSFAWIMDRAERAGLKSTFYFLAGRSVPAMDGTYEIDEAPMTEILRDIHARGHEIGLHPSYGTYLSPPTLRAEAERLKRTCADLGIVQAAFGSRMHYLRWKTPDTLRALAESGLEHDSSLGFADSAGFRCGTCFEYTAFDPVSRSPVPVRIRPLVAMECSVFEYQGASPAESFAIFSDLKRKCRAVQGQFSLLWHNSSLDTPQLRELFVSVLETHGA